MRILHITHSAERFKEHFDFLCKQLGHTGETREAGVYNFTGSVANEQWRANADYFNSFDTAFVSHLATPARTFLQNGWTKPLRIWLSFRFDHGIDDMAEFHELMKRGRRQPNVKICASSEHDALYMQRTLGGDLVEVVPFFSSIDNTGKIQIPCGPEIFYLISKHNETLFMDLKAKLDELKVPAYKHNWEAGAPDLRGVRGIIHIPYFYATRSLYENLAIENVFFLPSLDFFRSLMYRGGFHWDVHGPAMPEISEWYKPKHAGLFVYFNSFEHLKEISDSPFFPELIAERKHNIREFNQRHNQEATEKWRRIFT